MPNQELTLENLNEEVRTTLGASNVEVEAVDKDIKVALRHTLRLHNRNRPGRGVAKLSATASQKRYGPLNSGPSALPGFQGVTHVHFVNKPTNPPAIDPFDPSTILSTTVVGAEGLTFGEYAQQLYFREDVRRVLSSEPDWRAQWEGSDYYLYVDIAATIPYDVMFEYAFHFTSDSHPKTGMQLIPESDVDWIINMVTARVKQSLGRARAKFGGIADDQGGVQEVDGREMLQEGKEEERELKEEIRRRRRPLVPVIE